MRRLSLRGCWPWAAALLLASGCAQRAEEPAVQADRARALATQAIAGQHLRRQLVQSPRTLDPSLNMDVSSQRIIDDLFEGLVRLDPAGQIVPGVATSWEMSADGRSWTFHLRDDARWSNGDRVTAADFVYAWRRVVDPRTASASAEQLAPIVNALAIAGGKGPPASLGVAARDPQTLDVRLEAPTAYFLQLLTNWYLFPLHQATIETHGASWTDPGKLIGNGAFVLASHRINGALQLRRNPHYWDAARVRLNEVTYYPLTDFSAATSRYLAGDLDLTDGFLIDDIGWLRERLGREVLLAPYFGTMMFAMHVGRPPFDSAPLRLAMTMAIDRDVLTQKLQRGLYLPAYNIVPPLEGYPAVLPEWALLPPAQRHARARELYAEAGFSQQRPLRVELAYPTTSPDTRRVIEAMAAMWRMNLGAEVTLSNEEWLVHQQNRRLGKFSLYWYPWIADYADPLTFLALLRKGNGQNYGQYLAPDFEQAMASAASTADPQQRQAEYERAEGVLNADAPFIPIYFYQSRHLLRPYVKGWQSNAMDRNLSRDLYMTAGGG